MCGRFGVEQEYIKLAQRYQATVDAIDPGPRYNVAPTQPVAVIRERSEGGRVLTEQRWGLVPHWAKDLTIGNRMINARAETIATLAPFRDYLVTRRCIVPATRFYEWQQAGKGKQPFSIQRRDGLPMSFAGLWAAWWDKEAERSVHSCTIITTTPNAVMASLHNRMPVILDDDLVERWLDSELTDPTQLRALLQPCPDRLLHVYPVSRLVNNARNEGPELTAPEPAAQAPAGLFD